MTKGMRQPHARQLVRRQKQLLQRQQHEDGGELAADQRDVPDARIEAAPVWMGDFAEIGRARSIFAALAKALQQARDGENDRRGDADASVGRSRGDKERAEAHQQHGAGQRVSPSMPVGEIAEQRAAERAHEKCRGEEGGRRELLRERIGLRKEGAGEIERKRRIGVNIIPFDQIAGRADQDRFGPPADVGRIEAIGRRAARVPLPRFGRIGDGGRVWGCRRRRALAGLLYAPPALFRIRPASLA